RPPRRRSGCTGSRAARREARRPARPHLRPGPRVATTARGGVASVQPYEGDHAMGKYLKLGDDPGGQNWTLPDHADLNELRDKLAEAMEEENAVRIQVVTGRKQTVELIVNGSALAAALVWEDAPSDGGMTIID